MEDLERKKLSKHGLGIRVGVYAMKLERIFVQELRDELQKPKKKKFMTPERKKKLRQVLTTIHQPLLHLQIHLHLHPGVHFHFI